MLKLGSLYSWWWWEWKGKGGSHGGKKIVVDVAAHACNSNTGEQGRRNAITIRPAWVREWGPVSIPKKKIKTMKKENYFWLILSPWHCWTIYKNIFLPLIQKEPWLWHCFPIPPATKKHNHRVVKRLGSPTGLKMPWFYGVLYFLIYT